uniref:CHASE2 domain-containing protein n=1 Tax=Ascaris lumbricoides TaxID=6252 RepID=A0A0M3I6F4_ASCLU
MFGKSWHWSKQAFVCFLPIYPLGHLFINCYRIDNPLSWIYIKRVDYPIPDHLSELVESELENVDDLPKADLLVTLTDKFDARSYGGFYLRPAVEMQIPLRAAIRDLEEAAHLGANIEVDIGIARRGLASNGIRGSDYNIGSLEEMFGFSGVKHPNWLLEVTEWYIYLPVFIILNFEIFFLTVVRMM